MAGKLTLPSSAETDVRLALSELSGATAWTADDGNFWALVGDGEEQFVVSFVDGIPSIKVRGRAPAGGQIVRVGSTTYLSLSLDGRAHVFFTRDGELREFEWATAFSAVSSPSNQQLLHFSSENGDHTLCSWWHAEALADSPEKCVPFTLEGGALIAQTGSSVPFSPYAPAIPYQGALFRDKERNYALVRVPNE